MKKQAAVFGLTRTISLLIILSLASCSSMTLTGEWKDKNYSKGPFKKYIVIGLFKKLSVREGMEDAISRALRKNGVEAISSLTVLTPDREIKNNDRDLDNFLHLLGVDGVLIVRLLGLDKSEKYVPGSVYYTPGPGYAYGGPYMAYYFNYFYPVRSPGYHKQYVRVNIECILFTNETNNMVWKAQTRSIPFDSGGSELETPKRTSADLARIIVAEFMKNGFLPVKK